MYRSSDKSYNEIEKSKSLKSKRYPTPREIKQNLGDHIGSRVVDLIPRDIFQKFKFNRIDRIPPTDFEVTMKNVLSDDIKLTTTDITDDTEINLTRVKSKYKYNVLFYLRRSYYFFFSFLTICINVR